MQIRLMTRTDKGILRKKKGEEVKNTLYRSMFRDRYDLKEVRKIRRVTAGRS